MMLRWQRLTRPLTAADGPRVEVVPFDSLEQTLPYFKESRVSPEEYADRIAARQEGVARRMLS
jgi:hypothetical protein